MTNTNDNHAAPRVGLALGSGSARGWAHIGIIQQLEAMGIRPTVVAGTSIGALVGAAYVSGVLDDFAEWVKSLTSREAFSLMDFTFSGGFIKGEKLFDHIEQQHSSPAIETLDKRFATVATDMKTGREVWFDSGSVFAAARASCVLPGLFSPYQHKGRWLLDGGLVNPVPVSVARAYGADVVIAVNLNAELLGPRADRSNTSDTGQDKAEAGRSLWQKMFIRSGGEADADPGLLDVIASSVNIMEDRITRSRMAGDPPEITLVPALNNFNMMDFHRGEEAIVEGQRLVKRHRDEILSWSHTRSCEDE